MCCNTAHYFIDELETKIGIKFINILDEVAKVVADVGATNWCYVLQWIKKSRTL